LKYSSTGAKVPKAASKKDQQVCLKTNPHQIEMSKTTNYIINGKYKSES